SQWTHGAARRVFTHLPRPGVASAALLGVDDADASPERRPVRRPRTIRGVEISRIVASGVDGAGRELCRAAVPRRVAGMSQIDDEVCDPPYLYPAYVSS